MKFSIIMPTFDRPQFVHRAIMAVLEQDWDDWELVVQNGGEPMDNPYDDPRIRLFNEKDGGITDAMNRGMARASGDVFCWANDDDEMAPGTLRWVSESLSEGWGYGLIEMTDGQSSHLWGNTDPSLTLSDLLGGNFVPQPSVFWTREAYEDVGPMSEEHDLTSDYDYWIRLWKFQEPQRFDRVMAKYSLHPGQITQTRMAEQLRQAGETAKKHK